MTKAQQSEQNEARETLRAILKPGATIYCVLAHVSRSGMQREIKLYTIEDGNLRWLSGLAAKALGERRGKRDGIVVNGCGMDMGFHLVSSLSATLYPEGFGCTGERCGSNDHSNGDRDYTAHGSVKRGPRCQKDPCTCHDVSAWKPGETYLQGCSCGCHWANHWHRSGDYALRHEWM